MDEPEHLRRQLRPRLHGNLRGASFDRVLLAFMLFHLESPLAGLREARRVLRAGGSVGTLTWAGDLESNATRLWNECLDQYGAVSAAAAGGACHDAVDTPGKMESLLRSAGFSLPRSCAAEFVVTIESPQLLRLTTGLGSAKLRFDSLAPPAQEACLAGARGRLQQLTQEDFVARVNVIHSVAKG